MGDETDHTLDEQSCGVRTYGVLSPVGEWEMKPAPAILNLLRLLQFFRSIERRTLYALSFLNICSGNPTKNLGRIFYTFICLYIVYFCCSLYNHCFAQYTLVAIISTFQAITILAIF